ncbi:hypothetical protein ACP4OV_026916 [Aristida adscensionis]
MGVGVRKILPWGTGSSIWLICEFMSVRNIRVTIHQLAVWTTGKMRRSKRLNVVQINGSHADGRHDPSEFPLPQDEPNDQNQTFGEDEIQVGQQDNEDVNVLGEDGEVQKRGPTILPHVWDLPAGKRILVKCNKFGQPIGREGGVLGQFLGTVARNGGYCPLDKNDWRLVKRNGGDETILELVKTKFLYPRSCEKWILKSVGRDWKQYKAQLKKALFNVKKKISVLYKRCPEDVCENQWVALVKHWKSEEGKAQSERNKRSILMRKGTHTAGTKSYACWAEEMREADPQKKQPHRAKVYLVTHKQKGEQRNEHVDKLEGIMEEQPELGENDQGKVAWEGDALHKVLGQKKPGQVHGMGLLPVPKQAYGKNSYLLKDINTTTVEGPLEIAVLEEVGKLKDRIEKQDKIIEDLRNNKQASHMTTEAEEVNYETTYDDNFQRRHVHPKRKRVECDTPVQGSLSEQQDTSRVNYERTYDDNFQRRPVHPKRKRVECDIPV